MNNNTEEKCKSAMLNESKPSLSEKPPLAYINPEYVKKRNNRYYDKSFEKDQPNINYSISKSKQPKTPTKKLDKKRIAHSLDKNPPKNQQKIIEKFDNIFEKNQNYLYKNKFNYEETLKKLYGITNNQNNQIKCQSPTIRIKGVDQSFQWAGFDKKSLESPIGFIKIKMHGNYDEGLEKIDSLYKKNEMAIRDYIKIKNNLNFVCLVNKNLIYLIFFLK